MSAIKAIETADVRRRCRSLQVFKGVSLSVEQGEFLGLLGLNGAGKITLISIPMSLNYADSDNVRILGRDVAFDYRTVRRKLGVVPQELVLDPSFMVREMLRLQSDYFGLTKNDGWIGEVMTNLGSTNKTDASMRVLPGGMGHHVLAAQVLVHRPPVIVLDEPTADADVELRQTLWRFTSRLGREGHTVVLITRYPEEAESLCNHIAMLKFGEVAALDRTANLLSQLAGLQLVLSFAKGVLPASLGSFHLPGNHGEYDVRLHLSGYGEVEQILSTCRLAGCGTDDTEVVKTDLEDVFVQIIRRESGSPLGPQALAISNSVLESAA